MIFKNKKILIFLITAISLFGYFSSAMAGFPEIAGYSLEAGASMADFARYFFGIAIAIGGVIMFFVFVSAGLGLLLGHGEPSKFKEAKNRLLGSAIGLVILLSTYAIINTINSSILDEGNFEIKCVEGIERTIKETITNQETGEIKERIYTQCFNTNQPDLALKTEEQPDSELKIEAKPEGEVKFLFDKCSMREIIAYSEKDYKGEKTILFKDDTTNNDECPETKIDTTAFNSAGSVRFIFKQDGVYLYDNEIVGEEGSSPLPNSEKTETELMSPYHFKSNIKNFNDIQVNDKIDNIEFVSTGLVFGKGTEISEDPGNMNFGYTYGAVLFSEPEYRGKCLFMNYKSTLDDRKDLATGKDIDLKDDISSMIVFKAPFNLFQNKKMGKITLYAVPNCQDGNIDKDINDKGRYDLCTALIDLRSGDEFDIERYISYSDPEKAVCQPIDFLTADTLTKKKAIEAEGGEMAAEEMKYYPIQSLRIEGAAGVVVKSNSGNCHYFDLKESERRGNCITNLQDVFKTGGAGEKPKTIMIFPLDYK